MTCPSCADRGLFRVKYHDGSPDDIALCLCDVGQNWRRAHNNGTPTNPLWHVWAAINHVPHEHIAPAEDLLEPEEMEARGLSPILWMPTGEARDAALLRAGKAKRR